MGEWTEHFDQRGEYLYLMRRHVEGWLMLFESRVPSSDRTPQE